MARPDTIARLHKAGALYRAGNLAGAERLYRAILRSAPEDADALFMLGSLALQRGGPQALALLERAVRRKPLQPEFHVGLGNALRRHGRVAEAEASYRQALALRPGYAEARLNLGNVLAETGRSEDALVEYGAALEQMPELVPLRIARARVLFRVGLPEAALADAEIVLASDPSQPEALWLRAYAARSRGD